MKAYVILITITLILGISPVLFAANIWYDNFDDNKMNAAYKTPDSKTANAKAPKWVEEGGVMKQTEPTPGDPTYLVLDTTKDLAICGQLIKIRFDDWKDHDLSRAGLGFWNDSASYQAYATLIHNTLTAGNFQVLNDARAWGAAKIDFNTGGKGAWFWMKSEINATTKKLSTKVWTGALSAEPKSWMIDVDYTTVGAVRTATKLVGLNGGSANASGGLAKISFDEWYVYDSGGPVISATTSVTPMAKLATSWGDIKK
jgi:hypothetical protein